MSITKWLMLSAAVLLLPEFKEFKFSENDITKVVLKLQEQYSVHMSCPTTFDDGKHFAMVAQNRRTTKELNRIIGTGLVNTF